MGMKERLNHAQGILDENRYNVFVAMGNIAYIRDELKLPNVNINTVKFWASWRKKTFALLVSNKDEIWQCYKYNFKSKNKETRKTKNIRMVERKEGEWQFHKTCNTSNPYWSQIVISFAQSNCNWAIKDEEIPVLWGDLDGFVGKT